MNQKYGPMSDQVAELVAMTDLLTPERVDRIVKAYKDRGKPQAMMSLVSAKRAGRSSEVSAAMRDMAHAIYFLGMANEYDAWTVELLASAARNAGVAVATEDLIGTLAYSTGEYGRLVDPWFAGFEDLPLKREEAA